MHSFLIIAASSPANGTVQLLAYMAAGVGIFLVGIKFIGGHLKEMTGGAFSRIISKLSSNQFGLLAGGNLLGFLTQSGKANSIILAGFVQAGLLTVQRSLPMVFWGNAGASLIVIASVLPIKMIVMFVLGLMGLGLTFGWPKKMFHAYGAIFGVAMIMYGLFLLKSGAGGFLDNPELPALLSKMEGLFLLSFLVGTLLTIVAQSDMAVSMIAIAMASSGLFGLEESSMIVFGTQAGAGALTYGFSFNFKGRARQVVMGQVFFKALITLLFVALFYLETSFDLPLLLALVTTLSDELGTQIAAVTLIISFAGSLIALPLTRPIHTLIVRLYPPSTSDVLSEPTFLQGALPEDSDTALLLVEQEQLALFERFQNYLDSARPDSETTKPEDLAVFHEAFEQVALTVGASLAELSSRQLNEAAGARLIFCTKLQEQMLGIEDATNRIAAKIQPVAPDSTIGKLASGMLESFDLMILSAAEALKSGDPDEIESLEMVTGNRSAVMDRIRSSYFHSEQGLSESERNTVYEITILFESSAINLAQFATLLKDRPGQAALPPNS